MGDKQLDKKSQNVNEVIPQKHMSPLEQMMLHGGKAHKVRGMAARGVDSMIAVYNDRFTYTFITNNEVASVHFDKNSNKIFYSGHNIENMKLTKEQIKELSNVIKVLESDGEGRKLKEFYEATLGNCLADNK